ncbi:MAG: tRNA (guanosine(46)-N7)-methyltransferase TrmB [Peptococcaceae bacterium]|nr:tRNA (guanosine(46)-N7)-methyltransferase TrmB [Peptococcaceae bacterium]
MPRLRRKRTALPELAKDPKAIINPSDPSEYKGNWKKIFGNEQPIHLELGCGKGTFISQLAQKDKHINFIAVDKYPEVLVSTLRKINELQLTNVRILMLDIENIADVLGPEEIDKIYLNFSNPWPKKKHHKRRLTYPSFLQKYKSFLKPGAEIWFKTDDDHLFADSLVYFKDNGFQEIYQTDNLHQDDSVDNIMTEYEMKYSKQGIKIKFAIFQYIPDTDK